MSFVSKKTGRIESFDGTEIYYEERGDGDPMLYVYGIACLINHWRYQIEHFASSYRTVAFDFRGHNQSSIPEYYQNLTIDACARDTLELIKQRGIEKCIGVGHSFGTLVLIRAYEMDPSVFSHLVFVNGFASNPFAGRVPDGTVEKFMELLGQAHAMTPEVAQNFWRLALTSPIAIPLSGLLGGFNLKLTRLRDIEIYAKGVTSLDLQVFTKLFLELLDHDARHLLAKIEVPTLVVSGEKDALTPADYQTFMADQIPNSETLFIPYGSHCTQLDFPEFLNLRIEKFLSEN